MIAAALPDNFADWQNQARQLLAQGMAPQDIVWGKKDQLSLFQKANNNSFLSVETGARGTTFRVPNEFLQAAQLVACHRDAQRWDLLYQMLWRILHGERTLLRMRADPLACRSWQMLRQVQRDAHRMKGFLRFEQISTAAEEQWAAWYVPDHFVLELAAPFFVRRFAAMNWTILTPDRSAHWNQHELVFGPGSKAPKCSGNDAIEELWKVFYQSLYIPERHNLKAMKSRMPKKLWPGLPELKELHLK